MAEENTSTVERATRKGVEVNDLPQLPSYQG